VVKLFYFRSTDGVPNFGDDLNPWIWSSLLGDYLCEDSDTLLSGIGTLLNDRFPKAHRTIVFGSGVGFGSGLPQVDDTWTFYCVRGPLSAEAVRLKASAAVTDPALFVASLVTRQAPALTSAYSYMPHFRNASFHWKAVCQRLGFGYIDPRGDPQSVIAAMCASRVLITEAMHGAIVADALGIPWIAVRTGGPGVLDFKWRDWCGSLDIRYRSHAMIRLYASAAPGVKLAVKSAIATAQLFRISRAEPQLSSDSVRAARLAELHERLSRLKRDLSQSK
jgi:succinoglycan biosynthesis protein ExoV